MVHIEKSILLHASIERVFATVTDIPKTPQWVLMMQSAALHSLEPIAVGTTFVEKHELLGQSAVFDKIITEYEPPHRYAVKSTSGPVPHSMVFTFKPVEHATQFFIVVDSEMPSGLSGLLGLGDMLLKIAEEQLEGDLGRLKKLVEQQG